MLCEQILVKKVGEYCEGKDNNTTLPIKLNGVESVAILDGGAGVALATKFVWESWGKSTLRKIGMKLQLANYFIKSPIGLLEWVVVTSNGIEYEHTFAVVNFGQKHAN